MTDHDIDKISPLVFEMTGERFNPDKPAALIKALEKGALAIRVANIVAAEPPPAPPPPTKSSWRK